MVLRTRQVVHGGADRQLVAEGAQAGDHADRDVGKIGMPPKRLARLRVRQMQLNERQLYAEDGIPQGNAGVRTRRD